MSHAIRVILEKCIGCKQCIYHCPEPNVISINENKKAVINEMKCKLCQLCVSACPKRALEKGRD